MSNYELHQVEEAINYWRGRQQAGDDAALCPRARVLADVYGRLIFERADHVDARSLSPAQNEALNLALAQGELPL
jgi:hypothetical protein